MRVRGDVLPIGSFTLEEQPNKPGFCLVRFYENAEPFTETKDGLTVSGYQYDEYHLEMEDTGDLETDVSNNYETLLAQAKALEGDSSPASLEERVNTLEAEKADRGDVQAVWDQMAAAYSEGVQNA